KGLPGGIIRFVGIHYFRFTVICETGDTYTYHLTSQSLKRASEQSITAEHIRAFLQRVTGEVLPEAVQSLLEYWGQSSGPGIILERLVVLQVDTPEMMQLVWETSEIRRFLGRKLGELAVVVRADQWEDLINGLEARGIPIDSRL
ncbi:MAG: hypothetical protein GYB66_09170, partial [Chloroflexi bacterium]|nr:hypothetical protein [Chloroflexota bacterium]